MPPSLPYVQSGPPARVDERQEGLEKMHLEASSAAAKVDEL
eukprot:SAG11_NODE_19417_length_467_cov_0.703804_2_plen_40_part_01